ncbi:MAG: class D sortase [Candidatus Solibacter sp.]
MRLHIVIARVAPRTVARGLLLSVAIVCLALYGYDYIGRSLYQTSESREFDRMLAVSAAGSPAAVMPLQRPAPSAVIGRLSVPRLRISAMVREGVGARTLKLAIGHIPATALPGQAGNIAVAGHRDTFFRALRNLKTGDQIQFSTLSGDFRYVVDSLTIVAPDNAASLAPTTENVLTMVTCYPFYFVGDAPRRFVVRARQIFPLTLAGVSVK